MSPKTCHSQVKRMGPGGRLLLRRKQMLFSILISAGLLSSGLHSGFVEPVMDTLHLSMKAGYDDIYYTSIYGDSNYGQTEVQLNSSHSFQWIRCKSIRKTGIQGAGLQ